MATEGTRAELDAEATDEGLEPVATVKPTGIEEGLRPLDKGAVQRELDDTIIARKAVESQMGNLEVQMENLRSELEFCQHRRDAFLGKEVELKHKLNPPMPSLTDFFEGKVQPQGPVMFQLEGQHDRQHGHFNFSDGEDDDTSVCGSCADPWEDGLDSIGIAKCRLCGLKVPVDMESIEKHSKECPNSEHERGELLGKCHACGMLLPLNTEEIERHLNVCVMKKAPPVRQVPVPGSSGGQSADRSSSKRTSSLWTLLLPARPGCGGGEAACSSSG